jgi:flagella basal body P-ring formation protein FlgA
MRAAIKTFGLILSAAAMLLGSVAFAGQPVTLRSELVDGNGQVTLNDLFDDAGAAGSVMVANGMVPGRSLVLDAGEVQRLASRNGLDWANSAGLRRLIVRSGAEPMASVRPRSAPTTPGPRRPLSQMPLAATVETLTYARSLMTGEQVQPEDLVYSPVLAQSVPADAPRDADGVIGMSAKRPLRAGQVVSGRDLTPPVVIHRDDLIQITYRADGITVSVQAKALGNAATGDSFSAQNTSSKKTIEAVATGPGQALVGPEADRALRSPATRRMAYAQ